MKLSHLSFRYPDNDRLIFNELSLNLVPGQIHFLLGRNGEGKTTLLDILSGLIEVDCSIEDPFPRNEILYHIQGVPLLSTIKGKELAELILCVSGQYRKRDLSPYLFKTLLEGNPQSMEKIVYLWTIQYGKMSPGERRWFMVLLYCLLDKSLYLFDEPTAGIDVSSEKQITGLLRKLQEKNKCTIVIVTHNIQDLKGIAHYHVHLLSKGKIVVSGDEQEWIRSCRQQQDSFCRTLVEEWDKLIDIRREISADQ
ncbi:AAA family ATPase [Sporolactobacillus laevolacticus]|uniref:ABC transporter domain-containing protein n=1 Tax=Sporolactobacillus laevolacticus DSM 442 TaxID=1395513 RepID=V6J094_9BACL|nr:AAA family ATPase [Sporolactobacillus laevolacticus]EST13242.1 hypothetical protein P343_03705 [Sporolactobacillus laevolacticus DSM 442]